MKGSQPARVGRTRRQRQVHRAARRGALAVLCLTETYGPYAVCETQLRRPRRAAQPRTRTSEAGRRSPAGPVGVPDARNRARARRGTARNALTTGSDDMCMTDTPPPAPESPEDQHLALMTALMKIFATGRDDEDR